MSSKINTEQLEMVRLWASQGIDLNGIQKNLVAECGVHLTYMEVRFLLLDHGIEIARPQEEPKPAPAPQPQAEQPAAPAPAADPMTGAAPVKPTMSLDDIQIPGTILSGKCEFPSGTKVAWQIDQMGQLNCSQLSGTMTQEEQQAFVFELRQILSKM
ncbi:MAG: hypothetical protein IKL98_03665 [Akkermansia sp.]|nr:hypothetical protein [Akkermansia sp.]MBR3944311.1 hypothetical protein [Akkermansia sp.]